jgi:hypothetical protein
MCNLSNENVEVDGKLDCMWLSPNQEKGIWILFLQPKN